jgi:dienelactone hydrolase
MNLRLLLILLAAPCLRLPAADPLPGTQPLTEDGDLAAKMVQGIHRFLDRETAEVTKARATLWKPDTSSPEAWEKSMEPKRARLRQLLGMVDERAESTLRSEEKAGLIGERTINRVDWDVFRELKGEGLLADSEATMAFIVVPDCGTTPEQVFGIAPGIPAERQWANRLAGMVNARVLAMPVLDRREGAQMPEGRKSKFSQREVVWRAGFEIGRTVAGYEVQKVLAAVDALRMNRPKTTVGVVGTGEGGLIALLAAAIDPRITSVGVEGAFGPWEAQWTMPVDRTVFGFLREFGAAELAVMVAPRAVVISSTGWPDVTLTDTGGGAPGRLAQAGDAEIQHEIDRGAPLFGQRGYTARKDKSDEFLRQCMRPAFFFSRLSPAGQPVPFAMPQPVHGPQPADEGARQARMFNNLLEDTQQLMREAQKARGEYWKSADFSSAEKFAESAKAYREKFWTDVIGKLPPATLPPSARSRPIYETEKFTGWEVMLDVYPDVFSYGILLLPKGMKSDEKRAVVVCQHGLEGRPSDLADPKLDHPAYHTYGARLAEKGYIVFAPQNPYIGRTEFRQICRKAWPLGLSLWSFIVRQHETILTWLKTQPNVDASRIAFYGLSYGGKTAMRIPALLTDYCLSICSADYNEWIWKNVDASAPYSYLHTVEYDMVEWNLGNTFNYAEMSWLIFPRPFMVERGHDDGVSCDEWVAYEFARTRRHYSKLGLADRAEIEFFNGPHTINGQGTFRFLDKWLQP